MRGWLEQKEDGDMKSSGSAEYYHVCTDGNAINWIFKDDADFIAGINRIGICAIETGVLVIAFILMDNHVHFILYGSMPQCKNFITKYKLLTGKWISTRYNLSEYLKHLPSHLILIEDEEQLLDTVAYIDRNSIVAGYKFLPSSYPWGTAKYMFQTGIAHPEPIRTLSKMTKAEMRSTLKTWALLPENWKIDVNGMILPECFIELNLIERLFKSPAKYLYHLSKKLEGKIELKEGTKTFLPDKDLRPITETLSTQLYGTAEIKTLDFNSRILIAKKLRYNYAATTKQISRMVGIADDVLSKFI